MREMKQKGPVNPGPSILGRELINTFADGLPEVRFGAVSGLPSRRAALPSRAMNGHTGEALSLVRCSGTRGMVAMGRATY